MNWLLQLLGIQSILLSPDDTGGIGDVVDIDNKSDEGNDDADDDNSDDNDDADTDDNNDDSGDDDSSDTEDTDDNNDGNSDDDNNDTDNDDDDDDGTTARVSSYTDIKKEYPDLFKKHPDLKAALFRDEKITELFGSIKNAEVAVQRSNVLTSIEHDLFTDGDPTKLLETIKKNGGDEVYEKIITATFQDLEKNNKDLYLEFAAVPIKKLCRAAFREAEANGDKNLKNAALYIHRFFFNTTDVDGKVKLEDIKPKEKSKEQIDYEKRLKELNEGEYTRLKSSVDQSYVDQMSKDVLAGLDKDDRITPFMQKVILREVLTEIKNQLEGDDQYQSKLSNIWKQAQSARFSNDFKSRIVNTALARAKSLIPEVRKRIISDALSGKKKSNNTNVNNNSRNNNVNTRPNKDSHRPNGNRRESQNGRPERKLTDIEILRGKG